VTELNPTAAALLGFPAEGFGIRYEEAVLDWMAELPAILPPSQP